MKELDTVVLKRAIPEHGLVGGNVGTVVMIHGADDGYEVELVALDGETIVVATLEAEDIRPTVRREIAHGRLLDARLSSWSDPSVR